MELFDKIKKGLFLLSLCFICLGQTIAQTTVAKIGTTEYPSLQAALDAAREMTGDVTVELLEDITEQVSFRQKEGLDLTIDGGGNTMTGQMFLHGDGRASGTDKLTVTNFNFEYDPSLSYTSDTKGFICYWPTSGGHNYAHNVTMSNCTCTGNDPEDGMTAFRGPSGSQSYNTTIDHVVASNMHSLAQFQGAPAGLTITNCKAVTNVKNGINVVNGAGVITISKDTLTCSGTGDYSFRIDGTQEAYLSDNVFTSPVLLRGTASGKIYISSGVYDIIQEANYSAPTRYSITGGTFNHDVTDSCATGYGCYKDVAGYPAGWTVLKMYWVTYDANGGNGTPMTPSYVAPIPNTSFTVKENEYTWDVDFTNWNTKADGTGDPYDENATMTISSDTTLYAQWDVVAMIGSNPYGSLQDAIDDANANMTGDVTINLMKNTSEVVTVLQKAENNLTINGNGNTLTGQMFISANGNNWDGTDWITIQNLKFKYDVNYFEGTGDEIGLLMFCKHCYYISGVNCYAHNITIENCDFDADGSNKGVYGVAVVNSVKNITVDHCTTQNAMGLALMQSGTPFAVTNCKANDVIYGLRLRNNTGPHTIANDTIVAEEIGIYVDYYTTNTALNLSDNKFEAPMAFKLDNTCTGGTFNITGGTYIGTFEDNATSDFFNISGGTYSEDVTGEPCAPGYAAFANGTTPETWTVAQAWFLYYDKNETGAEGTMDTLFVRRDGTAAERTLEVAPCEFTWLPNHSFKEWNTKADGTGTPVEVGNSIELTSDTTLYVIWQEGNTIIYHNNGGTGTIANQYKAVDETITLSDGTDGAGHYLFNKTDSTLYRWNTQADESGTPYALGATYSANTNLDLYAVWRLNLDMTSSATDVVCYGQNNGTDTVKIVGGEAPYQIVLSGGALETNKEVTTTETKYIFTDLKPSANAYKVQLTDVLTKDTIRASFTISQPDTLVISSITVPDRPCPLMGTGTYEVSMTTTGGNGGNVITWGGDATNVDALSTTVTPDADDRDRTYTVNVTVTDKKGCVATANTTFSVAPVIAHDETSHSNTTMTIAAINKQIIYGCDTIIRDFGTPTFTFTNAAIDEHILDTVYNNVTTIAPDSIFPVGTTTITWTAVDTCGHTVTATQDVVISHMPCPTAVDGDGISYSTVRIGCYCWMAENLRSTHYSDGSREIPNVMHYPSTTRAAEPGNLYDWYAVVDTTTNSTADIEAAYAAGNSVRGICPAGWHVPTEAETANLMNAASTEDLMSDGSWIPDNGTGNSGFNMEPAGEYNSALDRYERKYVSAYFWVFTPPTSVYHACEFGAACSTTELIPGSLTMGYSVRCVKNE